MGVGMSILRHAPKTKTHVWAAEWALRGMPPEVITILGVRMGMLGHLAKEHHSSGLEIRHV